MDIFFQSTNWLFTLFMIYFNVLNVNVVQSIKFFLLQLVLLCVVEIFVYLNFFYLKLTCFTFHIHTGGKFRSAFCVWGGSDFFPFCFVI